MKRREFLKNAGLATGGAATLAIGGLAVAKPVEMIKGELTPERTLELMTRKGPKPTFDELRMLMRDARELPDPYQVLAAYQVSCMVLYEVPEEWQAQAVKMPEFEGQDMRRLTDIIKRMDFTTERMR